MARARAERDPAARAEKSSTVRKKEVGMTVPLIIQQTLPIERSLPG